MRDNLDSRKNQADSTDQPALPRPGSVMPAEIADRKVPAGFGAHFPTNPPWQTRRAGWRMFVQGSPRQ
jgi:hypothetical protein